MRGDGKERGVESFSELLGRWNKIVALEVSIDTLRSRVEDLRGELEAAAGKMLTGDDKLFAMNADVTQWNKAKSRVRYTLPKAREFIHRATWAIGAPERKRLLEFFKSEEQPTLSDAQAGELTSELEGLHKQRQVLNAHGLSVHQECQAVAAEVEGALRTLQRNAAARATKSRGRSFR
jgi:predicted  nucleic acid-binding Zn-ribbon protein